MNRVIEFLSSQLKSIRFGEISPGIIDTLRVDIYGQRLTIKDLSWTYREKGRIVVQVYDPSNIHLINKTLVASDFHSYVSSKTQIIINLPIRSGEDREIAIRQVRKIGEEAKISIRNIRKIARKKQIAEEDVIQSITDDKIFEINDLIEEKVSQIKQ